MCSVMCCRWPRVMWSGCVADGLGDVLVDVLQVARVMCSGCVAGGPGDVESVCCKWPG